MNEIGKTNSGSSGGYPGDSSLFLCKRNIIFFQCKLCGSSKVVPKHPVDRRRSPSPTLCSSVSTKPLRFLQLVLDSPALRSRLGCRWESAPLSGSISSLTRLQRVVVTNSRWPVIPAPFGELLPILLLSSIQYPACHACS